MSFLSPSSPGLGPVPREYFKNVQLATGPTLPGRLGEKLSDVFGAALATGADPSKLAFEAAVLQNKYPGERAFQPGGDIWQQMFQERVGTSSKKEDIRDANYLSMNVLGQPLSKDYKKWIKSERPSQDMIASMMYSDPQSTLAAFPTAEEDRISAYYGRMVPSKEGFTGKRYSSITPLEYTGGIA